ncbi:hypothetical protein [Microtetraspora sp. NBRC 16547]|uniref:hypothetical protein n=1 Tax=Microtetraspora sp. NBRC 16547 TaxID=3030993 RepID=UPI0024A44ED3|nr:hypothetical protein [Microtetraspora sp. NBRC 16547]GLW99742.1 hypothetical protein Misp02_38290 [Microtetraspora sp. NBRC 16547]
MSRRLIARAAVAVAVPLAAFGAAAQTPAAADDELAIRSVTVQPGDPVVGPSGSVKLVIDVVARGARGDRGVSVKVDPGPPPGAATEQAGGALQAVAPAKSATSSALRPPWINGSSGGVSVSGTQSTQGRQGTERFTGWEKWRFQPETALSRWYPSGQWTVVATAKGANGATVSSYTTFYLRRETRLEGVSVNRDANGARVTGTLLKVDPSGRVDYRPFADREVTLRFRQQGSTDWKDMGTAVTNKDGWFEGQTPAKTAGTWQVEFTGTGHYASDTSVITG